MALEQALGLSLSSSTNSLLIPRINVVTSPSIFSVSSLLPLSISLSYCFKQFRSLKCSAMENYGNHSVAYPRPPEISWKKELTNTVSLIGIVGVPIEIKHLPSGKALAWTRLAVKKSSTDTSWISLTFWDDLAHVAFQHVEKGQQIHVSGRLVSDTVESDDGKQQTYYKVVVQQLNLVEKSFAPVTLYDQDTNFMMEGRKLNGGSANSMGSIEEQWQAFFANPVEWWDNRKNKKNPKYPDFKHKDTGEALWVEGRNNPPWVKSQLAILDTRMRFLNDQGSRRDNSLVTSDDFPSF